MATFLFKILPGKQELLNTLSTSYPEADPLSLYTHMWLRLLGTTLEDSVETFLRRLDMSSGRFLLLMFLELRSQGMKPSEIAANLSVTQATVTGLIDGLEQTGFVQRREHEKDRRACVVTLTDKGQTFIRENRPQFTKKLSEIYSPLATEERQQLITLLEKLFQSLKPAPISS
ncbi:MAG: MarR family transcriptional regulator [Bdellovibrionaceae bacterium]|nr:MarR family transcriptional regulator [Pseudobdellovibrionaceae bacterium]